MKLLRNRKFAVALTAVVILCSAVFGSVRSLNAVRSDILATFEQGVAVDLDARRAVCANLVTVAQKYLPESDWESLNAELKRGADNAQLQDQEARALIEKLQKTDLSEQDAKYVSGFLTELDSRAYAIQNDPYNTLAEEFNDKTLRSFPVNLLNFTHAVKTLPTYE